MNLKISLLAAAAAAVALASCDSKVSLANDTEGQWTGTPATIANETGFTVTAIDNFSFDKSAKTGGDVTVTSMVTLQSALPADTTIVQSLATTVAARVDASGAWAAIDDDELSLLIDPAGIKITIDPTGVVLDKSLLSGIEASVADSLSTLAADAAKATVARYITPYYLSMKKLDDVKIRDNTMLYEIGEEHYIMNRTSK